MIPAHLPHAAVANTIAPTYRDRLHPWQVVRQLPNLQNAIVARFRRRSQAEDYLKTLQRSQPDSYLIVFEPPTD